MENLIIIGIIAVLGLGITVGIIMLLIKYAKK